MSRFVDIHTHILPGVDDGAPTMAEAMALLRMAWQDGTGTVMLTPHYRGKFRKNTPQQLKITFEALCTQAKPEMPELELYLGNEAGWERELADKLDSGRVLTLAGTDCVLLEFDYECPRSQVENAVLELTNRGYTPVIAHVERYSVFRKQKKLAEEMVGLGALLQLNADSVLGRQGFGVSCYCRWLLKNRMVHFIATDAHDVLLRKPLLGECFRWVEKKYGSEYAWALFRDNGQWILSGER